VLRTDGGARGNPGPAGAGFVLERDGEVIVRGGAYLGETTNNVAEYEALIWGLENASAAGASNLIAYADSELVVKQMTGEYRVKNTNLKPLFARATDLSRALGHVDYVHVRREENRLADELANAAMDERDYIGDAPIRRDARQQQETLFE
jgi:ribonuclease HI